MNVHLLVTSRPEEDIYSAIKTTARTQDVIPIQSNLVAEDIRKYLRPKVQDEIDAAIIKNANGMFRWVSCQLHALENCLGYQSLRRALGYLPKTLDETYDRILENVRDAHKHFIKRILQVLAFSERPPRIDEAIDAIVIQPKGKPRFDPEDRLPVPREILRYCSGLVILVTREINSFIEEPYTVTELQLAHFSVKEYLTSDRLGKNLAPYFHEQSAKASLAKLDYRLPVARIRELFPLPQYCAQYWILHALGASRKDEEVQELILEALLNPEVPGPACFRLYSPDKPLEAYPREPAPGLYYASFVRLEKPVEHLLRRGLDVNIHGDINAQGGRYGNALQTASRGGHIAIVQLLLKNKAKINATGGYYELLLQKHTDINIPGGQFGNPVQAASQSGHKNIVRMLIRRGANLNSNEEEFRSPLLVASYYGHEEIVQTLLEHNARVDIVDKKMLIKKGADVNLYSGNDGYALQCASSKGHETTVLMLLDNGADINALGGNYGSAVQAASYGGHEKIVRILINKGADIHAEGGEEGSALEAASLNGHERVAEVLLNGDSSARYSIQDYNVALKAASWGGNERIVWILLIRGANVNAEGNKYCHALQTAFEAGHKKNHPGTTGEGRQSSFKYYSTNGASVNTKGGEFGNALQTASFRGYEKVVQTLLEKGADANARGGVFGNTLQAAPFRGHEKVVQMLIEKGADVKAQGGRFETPLRAASCGGHEKVVQILLEKGAESNSTVYGEKRMDRSL
ncbi:ankyrin repeat-containing domain protein [Macrophomina phaseolina]|uniref:Ankyrin repeat-containing domain protein n=1 Tax=Macrophomina phaseolina TaxID=35725 RepID=A0ABQ8FWL5_9PEZI|nr:ankyrin repeat-containing domain protein [Macrophomina phaseolina]